MREVQIPWWLRQLRLGGLYSGFGGEIRLDSVVELTLGNGTLLRQRRVAIHIELGLARLGLGLRELRLGLVEHGLKRARVDLEKDLPLPDERSFLIGLVDNVSGYLWLDLSVDVAIQRRDPFAVYRDIPLYDADDFDLSRWRRGSRFLALASQEHGLIEDDQQSPHGPSAFGNDM